MSNKLTVQELIDKLQALPEEAKACVVEFSVTDYGRTRGEPDVYETHYVTDVTHGWVVKNPNVPVAKTMFVEIEHDW